MVHNDIRPPSSPSSPQSGNSPSFSYSDSGSMKFARDESRMSVERTTDEEDANSRSSPAEPKIPSSVQTGSSSKAHSPMSICGEDSPPRDRSRKRTILDLSMQSEYGFNQRSRTDRHAFSSRTMVPPYSPMSSSASTSPASGSPSASPEAVKMDEVVSIHDIAKEVTDRRSQNTSSCAVPSPTTSNPLASQDFDLPKNFYGYYVYQLELASRYSNSFRDGTNGSPNSDSQTVPNPPVGKVRPTVKSDSKDEEIVSYGSLLEQALRNGLKRSPSETRNSVLEKKAKTNSPPPTSASSPGPNQIPISTSRGSSQSQISVDDVAKASLREMLHGKQVHEAKMAQQAHLSSGSSNGSRSSSPSVNLKTLLEPQSQLRDSLKHQPFRSTADLMAMSYANGLAKSMHLSGGKVPAGPHIYPHIVSRPLSPNRNGGMDYQNGLLSHLASQAPPPSYKHKKLLEWTAADVRDWISSLNYCSEFADVFIQQSVDGVALTLLNESHLMKNFGMKLGPAIKLRCAVWEILGLSQMHATQNAMSHIQMPAFFQQKPIPMAVGHCIPQHLSSAAAKQ